jgi:hypothetical protein
VPIIPKRISALLGCGILLGLGSFLFPSLAPLPGVFLLFIYSFIYLATFILGKTVKTGGNLSEKTFFWECDQIWQKIYKNLHWNIPHFFRVLFLEVEKFAPSSPEKEKKKKKADIES